MRIHALLLLLVIVMTSIRSLTKTESLLGAWRLSSIDKKDNRYCIYEKVKQLDDNSFGLQFLPKGKLRVCQSKSWCPVGETSINFETIEGSWSMLNDSVVQLQYPHFDSQVKDSRIVKWDDSNYLVLKRLRRFP